MDEKQSRGNQLTKQLYDSMNYILAAENERQDIIKLLKAILEFFPKDQHWELSRIHAMIKRLEGEPDVRYS